MKAKKIIAAIIAALCIMNVIVLSSCSSSNGDDYSSSNNNHSTIKTISESEAISIAQKSSKVQNKIADYWDMKFFYTPDWGRCDARYAAGEWNVTLRGNISGYTDDYKEDFIYDKTFKVTVTVSSTGDVTYVGYVSIH